MKTGLTTSVVLHAALLGFGLISLSAPSAVRGCRRRGAAGRHRAGGIDHPDPAGRQEGAVNEKPAPKPTKKPDIVPDAKKVGENKVDTDKQPTPDATPKQVEAAAMPEADAEARAEARSRSRNPSR